MMVALSRVVWELPCVAAHLSCLTLSGTAPTESLANAQFILAPTMDLTRHLA
jgi:hypothetical protein